MTQKEFYKAVANGEITKEVMQYAASQLQCDNDNETIADKILEILAQSQALSAADLANTLGLTVHKTMAICHHLVKKNMIQYEERWRCGKGVIKYYYFA